MARSAASIQASITILETFLASTDSFIKIATSDNTSVSKLTRKEARDELTELYQDLGRADGSSPMLVRGVVKGLR